MTQITAVPPKKLLLLILAVFIGLALHYIDITPYRQPGKLPVQGYQLDIGNPDERQHVNYIRYIFKERALPVFQPNSPHLYETYQSHQSPLYYVLLSPIALLIGDNNQIEKWALRLPNVLFGLLLIVSIYFGINLFTGNAHVALFSAAITSQIPMFIALCAAVTNDVLFYLLFTIFIVTIGKAWRHGWTNTNTALMGFVGGFAILTKITGVLLVPIGLIALFAWKSKRANLRNGLLFLFTILITAGPWLIRNYILYGDPLGMNVFVTGFHGTKTADEMISQFGFYTYWTEGVLFSTSLSFWGVFSYMEISMPLWIHVTLLALIAVACIGFVMRFFQHPSREELRVHMLNLMVFFFVITAFLRFNSIYFQGQARYLFPAIFPIASGFGYGIWAWCVFKSLNPIQPQKRFLVVGTLIILSLFCLNVFLVTDWLPYWFNTFLAQR